MAIPLTHFQVLIRVRIEAINSRIHCYAVVSAHDRAQAERLALTATNGYVSSLGHRIIEQPTVWRVTAIRRHPSLYPEETSVLRFECRAWLR